jgi:predicted MPP superfamily phosphohydrolase
MRTLRITATISTIIAGAFILILGSAFSLWDTIYDLLEINFPLLPILAALAFIFSLYCLWEASSKTKTPRSDWPHYVGMILADMIMIALFVVVFVQLDSSLSVITDTFLAGWPIALWFGTIIIFLWLMPIWKPLQNWIVRAGVIAVLVISALVWLSLPWQVQFTAEPVVFIQPGGVSVSWSTNMDSISRVNFGTTSEMDEVAVQQSDGILDINDVIQTVFIPMAQTSGDLYFQAVSTGIRSFDITNSITANTISSEALQVHLPEPGEPLSIVAFSDIHEQLEMYEQMSDQIDWLGVDEVIYIGDLLTSTTSAEQVVQNILSLPTGGELLPRVYLRGNHETRGETPRSLDEWLLPPDGRWYFSFTSGNVFFIVIDTGGDSHTSLPEYSDMNDFSDYYLQQAVWLQEVFASEEYQSAEYRVVLMHMPPFTGNDPEDYGYITPDLDPVIELLRQHDDIDLVMSGHIHEGGIWMPEETGFPFPVVTCGGRQPYDMAAVTATFGHDGITLQVLHRTGAVWDEAFLPNQ